MGKLNSSKCNWMDVGEVGLFKGYCLYFRSTSPICFFCILTNCTINRIVGKWSTRGVFSLTVFFFCNDVHFWLRLLANTYLEDTGVISLDKWLHFFATEQVSLRQISGKKVMHLFKSSVMTWGVPFSNWHYFELIIKISKDSC